MRSVASYMSSFCVSAVAASLSIASWRKVLRKKRVDAWRTASPRGPFDMRDISAWRNSTSARHVCGSRSK